MTYTSLSNFYVSKEWRTFRKTFIAERLARDGEIIDEYTGKPILFDYDIILHHKEPLTEQNVFDTSISLNPNNIMIVSHKSHNIIHDKFGHMSKKIYVVFGSPGSGKSTYVNSVMESSSLIVDVDRIFEAINGNNRNTKLLSNAMQIFNQLLDMVQTRNGQWSSAYIVVANCRNVERLVKRFDAELIHISTDQETCLKQAQPKIERFGQPYKKAIDTYWLEWETTYKKLLEPLI